MTTNKFLNQLVGTALLVLFLLSTPALATKVVTSAIQSEATNITTTQIRFNDNITTIIEADQTVWFTLPERHSYHQLTIQIPTRNRTLYYPIVTLYDRFKNPTRKITSPINLVKLGPYKTGFEVYVPFSKDDIYFTINTPKELVGTKFNVDESSSNLMPVYSNNGTFYISSPNTSKSVTYQFSSSTDVTILSPRGNQYEAIYSQQAWFFSMANKFGGDIIAKNPAGDNYRAGGGAELSVGYDFPNQLIDGLSYQLYGGFRYQGAKEGEGKNQAIIFKAAINYEYQNYITGMGFQYDVENVTADQYGDETKFKPALYPYVYAEYKLTPKINLSLGYVFAEFETESGQLFNGNQTSLGLKLFID